jgi:type I restriction enzyme S subunit
LGDVCSFEYGKALKAANRKIGGNFPVLGSNGCVGYHDAYLVNGPGVVIGRKGAAGEISFVGKNFWPIDTTYFLKLNKDLSLLYFYFLLKSLRLNQFEKSTAIPGLNRNDAYEQIIPLPPLPEQRRIVAKIEELFSSLDKGIESLKTAQQQLKVYRQAVLKWAFEGKLTNKNIVEGELPGGWEYLKLRNITTEKDGLRRGPFGSAIKKEFFVPSGYKIYEQGNAINDDPYRGNYFIDEKKYLELVNFKAIPGDLIVSCSGVTLGRISEIPNDAKPGIINQALLRIRLKHNLISNKYFILYFRGASFQKKIFDQSQGTAMPNLVGIKDFKEIELLIPPLPEQHAIVAEIESRLSVCDKIEESIEHSLKQSEALRQSILKKAFEGKLVPQDPNDEPASVLLDQIKAEREKQAAEQRNVNSKRKTKNKPSSVGAKC